MPSFVARCALASVLLSSIVVPVAHAEDLEVVPISRELHQRVLFVARETGDEDVAVAVQTLLDRGFVPYLAAVLRHGGDTSQSGDETSGRDRRLDSGRRDALREAANKRIEKAAVAEARRELDLPNPCGGEVSYIQVKTFEKRFLGGYNLTCDVGLFLYHPVQEQFYTYEANVQVRLPTKEARVLDGFPDP